MDPRVIRRSAALLLAMLLSLLCALPCFAAGGVGQVNLPIGQTPDTVYLTYSAPDAAQGAVAVTGPGGTSAYTAAPVWSDPAGKYLYSVKLDGLVPGGSYTYEIADTYSGAFRSPAGSGAPIYLTGGESGAVKWYAARSYRVSAGDPLTSNYRFLDVDRAVPALDPWGTDTCQTHEQTYTLIHVDGDTMIFSTYMFRYDGRRDQMMTAPYLYDSLILRRGDTARADMAATAEQAPNGVPSAGYADVPENAWYAGAVNTVSARGLLDVRSESRFAPGESLTRAELVTALYRLAGMPAASAGAAFPDVPRSSGCYDAVSWAASAGLVSGMPDGRFAPDRGITRAQLAAMLYRYSAYSGASVAAGSGIATYADWRQVGAWCREPLSWAVGTGLLRGKPGNRLAPSGVVTRAEGAVFIQRLL